MRDRFERRAPTSTVSCPPRRRRESSTSSSVRTTSCSSTPAAVLQLVEAGTVALDEPVQHYLPSLPYESAITIRQLLTHTAGIPNPIPLGWVHLATAHGTFDEAASLAAALRANGRLRSRPGEKYAYSNLGYWLLGPVVERASGQVFTTYVTEHVLRPLGVPASELGYTTAGPSRRAAGYLEKYSLMNVVKRFMIDRAFIGTSEGPWLLLKSHYVNGSAFGGLIGSSRGFGKFLQDQLRPHSVLFDDRTRALFYAPQRTRDGRVLPMTPGWHVASLGETRYFFKEGGGGGFHAMMRVYLDRGIASVVLTNATGFDVNGCLDFLDPQFLP